MPQPDDINEDLVQTSSATMNTDTSTWDGAQSHSNIPSLPAALNDCADSITPYYGPFFTEDENIFEVMGLSDTDPFMQDLDVFLATHLPAHPPPDTDVPQLSSAAAAAAPPPPHLLSDTPAQSHQLATGNRGLKWPVSNGHATTSGTYVAASHKRATPRAKKRIQDKAIPEGGGVGIMQLNPIPQAPQAEGGSGPSYMTGKMEFPAIPQGAHPHGWEEWDSLNVLAKKYNSGSQLGEKKGIQ